MDKLLESKDMEDLAPLAQSKKAIGHALDQIRYDRRKWELFGFGMQTYSLLTEAFATLNELPVKEVREAFMCKKPAEPEKGGGRFRCGNCKTEFWLTYAKGMERPRYCPFCNKFGTDLY